MKKAEKLTATARKALCEAFSFAAELGSSCVGSEHLLVGLMRDENSSVSMRLSQRGITAESLSDRVTACAVKGSAGELPSQGLSFSCRRIVSRAAQEAAKRGMASVGAGHLLLGILSEPDCTAAKLLRGSGGDPPLCAEVLSSSAGRNYSSPSRNNKS